MFEPSLIVARRGHHVEILGNVKTQSDRDSVRDLIAEACAEAGDEPEIVVDVTRAGYLDSFFLSTLVKSARRCVDTGRTLALEGANAELLELLRVTKVDHVLDTHGARVNGRADT